MNKIQEALKRQHHAFEVSDKPLRSYHVPGILKNTVWMYANELDTGKYSLVLSEFCSSGGINPEDYAIYDIRNDDGVISRVMLYRDKCILLGGN